MIFGAGASFDSIPYLPPNGFQQFRPPLANELFAHRFAGVFNNRKYVKHLPPVIPRMLNGNVERKMEELRLEAKNNVEVPNQLAAIQYYLRDLIKYCQSGWSEQIRNYGGVTNYRSFINEVEGWRQGIGIKEVSFVTFNYDTLLEDALSADPRIGTQIKEMGDYVKGLYKVIKPHGSINWSHHISSDLVPQRLNPDDYIPIAIENAAGLSIDGAINLEDVAREPQYPALAIPVETKSDYECPKEHLEKLWEFLPSVKILIIVGWRARETYFMKRLAQGLSYGVKVEILSSNQQSAEEVKRYIEQAGLKGEIFASPASGFTQFEKNVETQRFLYQMTAKS